MSGRGGGAGATGCPGLCGAVEGGRACEAASSVPLESERALNARFTGPGTSPESQLDIVPPADGRGVSIPLEAGCSPMVVMKWRCVE